MVDTWWIVDFLRSVNKKHRVGMDLEYQILNDG